ncbi:MAG TPA: SPFH domain-containing protein, partial [Phycisphaerales bacterium]|nr:SPFH domain-containing protein [Phycisphaerales bacterium]
MDFWKKLTGELIDIVQWTGGPADQMVSKFERYGNEIKNGAKLVVREGQAAVFVNEGKIADVFQPGTFELTTRNLPILSTLQGWKYGFESPFKAEVYFVVTRRFTDLKWGTKNPVMTRDPEFGPVRLRAFGTYVMQVNNHGVFVKQVVGTDGAFTSEGITEQLRNTIVARFADVLGESKMPILDLAANYDEMGKFLRERIASDMSGYGIDLVALLVENVSLPEEVEAALDKRSSMGVIGDMNRYTQFQSAEAMRDAAKNPSGTAGAGMGMGMGFAMANQMGQTMAQGAAGGKSPPPMPGSVNATYYVAVNGQQTGPFDMGTLKSQV